MLTDKQIANNEKYCPLLLACPVDDVTPECRRKRCAWWVPIEGRSVEPGAGACAMVLMAPEGGA